MSFLGKLFGTDKALNSVIESVSNGLDSLVHTDEEKSQEAAADRSEARKMLIRWMEATQGQNLARRVIALSITSVWLLQYVVAQCMAVYASFSSDVNIDSAITILRGGADDMSSAVMLILAFYFAAPHMGAMIEKVKLRSKNDR
jgi:hypothetical protein